MKRGVGKLFLVLSVVVILSFTLVSAGLFSDMWGKITGQPIKAVSDDVKSVSNSLGSSATSLYCYDSDNGLNYNIAGMVFGNDYYGNNFMYNDSCINSQTLKEWFCWYNMSNSTNYNCANGCLNGACITNVTNNSCVDRDGDGYSSDGGICGEVDCDDNNANIYSGAQELCGDILDNNCNGVVNEGCTSNQTQCNSGLQCQNTSIVYCSINSSQVCQRTADYLCLGGQCVLWDGGESCSNCPNGCSNGACVTNVTNQTCTDSDGGLNYNVKGIVSYSGQTYTDYCVQNGTYTGWAYEYACSGGTFGTSMYNCPNGCSNGACLNSNNSNVTNSSLNPFYLIYDNGPGSSILAAVLTGDIQTYLSSKGSPISSLIFPSYERAAFFNRMKDTVSVYAFNYSSIIIYPDDSNLSILYPIEAGNIQTFIKSWVNNHNSGSNSFKTCNSLIKYSSLPGDDFESYSGLCSSWYYGETICTGVSDTKEITEGTSKTINGLYITLNYADENALTLVAIISIGNSSSLINLSINGPSSSFTTVTMGGATYSIELVSASDTSATIKVTKCGGQSSSDVNVISVGDISGSMSGSKLTQMKLSNSQLISSILTNPSNRVGLVGYSSLVKDSDVHQLSNDAVSLSNTVNNWSANGGTCICCGINRAVSDFVAKGIDSSDYNAIVVMSDGVPNYRCNQSGHSYMYVGDNDPMAVSDAINAACDAKNKYGIHVYAAGLGADANTVTLQTIGANCGEGYFYGDTNNIVDVYSNISKVILASAGQTTVLTCTDSDGGLKYDIRGTTTYGNVSFTDFCPSSRVVWEYYCDSQGYLKATNHTCSGQCTSGVCKNLPQRCGLFTRIFKGCPAAEAVSTETIDR